jgi:hypothetical protein
LNHHSRAGSQQAVLDPPADPLVEIELVSIAPKTARHLVEELAAILGVDVLAGFGSTPHRSTGA